MPIVVRDNVNNKNVMLQVDDSNQLSVKDATNSATLSSINTALGSTLTVSDSSTHSKLTTIASALATGAALANRRQPGCVTAPTKAWPPVNAH